MFVNAVLVPIKVMPVKNDYFLLPKFELHSFQQMNGFLYWISVKTYHLGSIQHVFETYCEDDYLQKDLCFMG